MFLSFARDEPRFLSSTFFFYCFKLRQNAAVVCGESSGRQKSALLLSFDFLLHIYMIHTISTRRNEISLPDNYSVKLKQNYFRFLQLKKKCKLRKSEALRAQVGHVQKIQSLLSRNWHRRLPGHVSLRFWEGKIFTSKLPTKSSSSHHHDVSQYVLLL